MMLDYLVEHVLASLLRITSLRTTLHDTMLEFSDRTGAIFHAC